MKVPSLLFCVLLILFGYSEAQYFLNTTITHSSNIAWASTSVKISFYFNFAGGLGTGDQLYIILPEYSTSWDISSWFPFCSAPNACTGCDFRGSQTSEVVRGRTFKFNLQLSIPNPCSGHFEFTIGGIKNPALAGAPVAQGEIGVFGTPGKFNGVTLINYVPPPTPDPCGTITIGTGTGLRGDYYKGINFNAAFGVRIDSNINFIWNNGPQINGVSSLYYSVRWSGSLYPKFTGLHTFYTLSDDGVRLFINGQSVINLWTVHAPTESTGTYHLVAGQSYPIVLEFFNNEGGAAITLSWASPACGLSKEIIPSSQLSPKPLNICP